MNSITIVQREMTMKENVVIAYVHCYFKGRNQGKRQSLYSITLFAGFCYFLEINRKIKRGFLVLIMSRNHQFVGKINKIWDNSLLIDSVSYQT